jgi:hypothetical protein
LPYLILLIGATVVLYLKGKEFYVNYKRNDGEMDWPFFLGLLALTLQISSIFWELLNQLIYSGNGSGLGFFYVLHQLFGMAAQFVITVFLIMVSWGWTLTYSHLDSYDIYIPLIVMVGIVHLMIVGLGNLNNDDH